MQKVYKLSEVKPTKEDADKFGQVLAYDSLGWCFEYWNLIVHSRVTHWMRVPPSPIEE